MSERLRIDPAHLTTASAALLDRLREHPPLVHCITNAVVTNFTANALLAIGAAPAMVDIREESGMFAGIAGGLLVNLGTPAEEQRDAAREAVAAASVAGTPWVLDPVAIGALPVRTALAHELVAAGPTAIRGNASEIIALAGAGAGGRGVDAADSTDAAADAATSLALAHGSVVAVSGPVDLITDGHRTARIANGDALLTRITGGGCALGAVTAAFLAASRGAADASAQPGASGSTGTAGTADAARPGADDALLADPFVATVAATVVYTVAAELAAARSAGPGSFAPAFLDALALVTPDQVLARASITVTDAAASVDLASEPVNA
ncbi:hydroxyethylthiazole kinase [Agromyces sp. CF514]|uniref:hydroxyethylthiazole kinase n=1 Tax=Agromyces sp. CF514 TaxID=1881031 RepID=UPI0008E379E9|nr:hydroxyethylthiazole kinase [Agromyces sp. CF514]SFR83164.1 hydroxyethylthiazole kinase [Agromyces sp. CF514]